MKSSAIFSKNVLQVKALKACMIFAAVSALSACNNYTTSPVCNKQNAAVPPGLTGTYTLSIQNEDFTTSTQEIEVYYDLSTKKMSVVHESGEKEESSVCSAGGMFIQEELDDDLGLYEQQRLAVTGFGLILAPVFYDREELTLAGIASHLIEIPARLKKLASKFVRNASEQGFRPAVKLLIDTEEPVTAMVIENTGSDTQALMSTAKTGPVSFNFIRK